MAYLRSLRAPDCQDLGCNSRASAELINTYNANLGSYCRPHAQQRLIKQLQLENDCSETEARVMARQKIGTLIT